MLSFRGVGIGNRLRTYSLCPVFVSVILLTSCAQVVIENRFEFQSQTKSEASEASALYQGGSNRNCGKIRSGEKAFTSKRVDFSPYFYIDVDVMTDSSDSVSWFGPGVILPLPLIPNPLGWIKEISHQRNDASSVQEVTLVVKPVAYSPGWSLDLFSIYLQVEGHPIAPSFVEKIESRRHLMLENRQVSAVERVLPHNIEFLGYKLDYQLPTSLFDELLVRFEGVQGEGKNPLPYREELLRVTKRSSLHWYYDVPCGL